MTTLTVDEVRALRLAGQHAEHLPAARALVRQRPADALAQIEAAWACDRAGFEHEAITHYDEVYRLGVPAELHRSFTVGYGSTLRNVGRFDDALAILGEAVAADPEYPAFSAFLALALLSAGHPKAAMAALLGCALDVARPGAFDGYERALASYHDELLASP
ncbi:MAG: tetratricopeptide repeat protein [Deltaproteobacteria bacterium]|nr:tetratricopeptide repeat protein [Deltaproteobacteria bacterium]